MPPDRTRTANPQGRQKACAECAKGKRKCSLGQPSCARCTKQRLACTYPPQPSTPSNAASAGDTGELQDYLGFLDPSQDVLDVGQDASLTAFDMTYDPGLAEFNLSAGTSSLDALSYMLYATPDTGEHMALDRPIREVEKTFSAAHIAPSARSRVDWSIEQLKLAPRMMVEQKGTPWQHSMLYEEYLPRPLQDACAVCALYIAKNGVNDAMVARILGERVEEMIASPRPDNLHDLLTRAHAIMLYQIMLVFGGDIRLYSLAERLSPLMDEVGTALLPCAEMQVDPAGSLPLYPSTAARAAWTAYKSRESLRRTILCLYHFAALCYLLRGHLNSCNDALALGNRVTLSARLWNATSAFDFAVAWNTQNHFFVQELDFTEVMNEAQPEDVDVFAKMMMVGLQGEDDIKGWLYTKGGTL
jgi:hypothetical protein